jgi:hypothetical protein
VVLTVPACVMNIIMAQTVQIIGVRPNGMDPHVTLGATISLAALLIPCATITENVLFVFSTGMAKTVIFIATPQHRVQAKVAVPRRAVYVLTITLAINVRLNARSADTAVATNRRANAIALLIILAPHVTLTALRTRRARVRAYAARMGNAFAIHSTMARIARRFVTHNRTVLLTVFVLQRDSAYVARTITARTVTYIAMQRQTVLHMAGARLKVASALSRTMATSVSSSNVLNAPSMVNATTTRANVSAIRTIMATLVPSSVTKPSAASMADVTTMVNASATRITMGHSVTWSARQARASTDTANWMVNANAVTNTTDLLVTPIAAWNTAVMALATRTELASARRITLVKNATLCVH